MVIDYAELITNDVLKVLAEQCEEALAFGIEQITIRLLHVLAAVKHHEREIDDPRVFGEVAELLHQMSRRSPGLLNVVLQERRIVEEPNARH
jgi:hypothetical protein